MELRYSDGTMIAINTLAVENEIADNMYQRSELDYLIYNDPVGYADLILICTFVIGLEHRQQTAGDSFNGEIWDFHATVF